MVSKIIARGKSRVVPLLIDIHHVTRLKNCRLAIFQPVLRATRFESNFAMAA